MRPDSLVPATLSAPDVAPIRVLELELASDSEPRTPLPGATAGGKTALVLVRIHGEPVGTVHVGVPTNGLTRSQCIPAIARELGQPILEHLHRDGANSRAASDLCAAARMAQPACSAPRTAVLANPPSVSVVVATHDRPESVRNCIGSLARQTYPRFEVLVVVNAPPPAVDFRHVQRAFAGDARIRWLHEPLPGACRARNLGIEEARGQIIAFCDDDVIHDPDWLLELACAFQEAPGVGCATGLVCPAELDTDAQIWFEQYGGLGTGFTPRLFDMGANRPADPFYPFRPATFGVGTNMAYRAEVVRELGGFDPSLGPGTPACSGEDYALYYATLLDGY